MVSKIGIYKKYRTELINGVTIVHISEKISWDDPYHDNRENLSYLVEIIDGILYINIYNPESDSGIPKLMVSNFSLRVA